MGENSDNTLILLTDTVYPNLQIVFGGHDSFRESLNIDADEFIAVKSFKAKGKRLSTYEVQDVEELEPVRFPENQEESDENDNNEQSGDEPDEATQLGLFD